jgi:hypothetical protein
MVRAAHEFSPDSAVTSIPSLLSFQVGRDLRSPRASDAGVPFTRLRYRGRSPFRAPPIEEPEGLCAKRVRRPASGTRVPTWARRESPTSKGTARAGVLDVFWRDEALRRARVVERDNGGDLRRCDDEKHIDIAKVLDGSGARTRSIRATIAHANVKNVSSDRNRSQIEPQRFSSRNDSPLALARSVAKKMCVLQENDQSTRSV